MLNVHYYDGQLSASKLEIDQLIDDFSKLGGEEKVAAFISLKDKLSSYPTFSINARKNLDTIISDFSRYGRNNGPNYDKVNNLYADDLLLICHKMSEKCEDSHTCENILSILIFQLDEMSSGMCPQGRTNRLLQVILAFRD